MIGVEIDYEEARVLRASIPPSQGRCKGDGEMDWRHGRELVEDNIYKQLKIRAANGGSIVRDGQRFPLATLDDSTHREIAREMARTASEEAIIKFREDEPLRRAKRNEAI